MKRIISLALCFLLTFTLWQPVFAAGTEDTGQSPNYYWEKRTITPFTPGSGVSVNSISYYDTCYGAGKYVVAGSYGTILSSADGGMTWEWEHGANFSDPQLSGITYGNDMFVAVGGNNVYTKPSTGVWTRITLDSGTADFKDVTCGNKADGGSIFVAVGGGSPWWSEDGINWQSCLSKPNITGYTFEAVAADEAGNFVAVGYRKKTFDNNTLLIWKSSNGKDWTSAVDSSTTGQFTGLAYGNGAFVAGGGSVTNAWISTDIGDHWVQAPVSSCPTKIAYGNGLFMATSGNNIYISEDQGNTWTQSHNFGKFMVSVNYCDKTFIATDFDGNIYQRVPEFAGGSGSAEDPYLIETVDQLNNVRKYLGTEHSDKHFKLNANLDLDVAPYNSGAGWERIGTSTSPFTGTFDGGGYTISGLVINLEGSWNVRTPSGLFGYTGVGAKIHDLVLKDVDIKGCYYVGSLVGNNSGEITDVNISGEVAGEWDTGGLAGRNNGSISNSSFTGTVTGTHEVEYGEWTGGLVGYNIGTITNCWANATVSSGSHQIGGLVGENYGGTITGSYSSGSVTGEDYTGGLAGVSGDSTNTDGEITACYSTCTVNGRNQVGGLVGSNSGLIAASFAAGEVKGKEKVGGLAGVDYEETGTDCYWDTETSGQNTSACGTGKSTEKMKEQTTYQGWDFDGVWGINGSDNSGYPFLKWQVFDAAPTAPAAPQNFTATPGDGQVELSWTAPASDGGAEITRYEVSIDNGGTWVTASTSTSHTFTGLTNDTEYTFKVRAVNIAGNGAEASTTATPAAPPVTNHTVNFYNNGSLYASKTVASGSALGINWPANPVGSGYIFGGWFTGQNGSGTQYTSSTIINADVDLYAKWTYINGGNDNDGDAGNTLLTPQAPVYKAGVRTNNIEKSILITVNLDTGTASLGDDPWHERPQGRTVIDMPPIPGVGTYLVGIPVPDLSTTDVQGTLAINTSTGSIEVPSNMLTGVAGTKGNKAQIIIGQGDKSNLPENVRSKIGNRPLIQLNLSIDGKPTSWSNPNAPVSVSIPYMPAAKELANPENIVVWYIDGSGNVISVPNGRYDPATGTVTFTTTHFSYYAVGYNQVDFIDIANDAWYAKAVSFIAAREITSGTGEDKFSPEAKLTRGQFIVMLMKAYGIAPDLDPKDNFADAGNTYYTGYLAAARRLGISAGIGNNMYAPDKEITRQEMFTLLYNTLKVIGQLPQGNSGKSLLDFSDASQVASWAKEAMSAFVETGTVGGSGGKLTPTASATRAEMAQVLYNLLAK